jgi:agmatine deiminase
MRFRMPAEWEPHERTLIGFPCRPSTWGNTFEAGRQEFATVANTVAAFEPVTLVCADKADETAARALVSDKVETMVIPMDGSWLRDNGPLYVTDGQTRRARHFRFNAWGERHAQRDRDAALGHSLAMRLGDPVDSVDVVVEGGAFAVDGAGTLVVPEACLMHPNRNWSLDREEVARRMSDALGIDTFIWLEQGLVEDMERDPDRMHYGTDGHIDLFFAFTGPRKAVMYAPDPDDVNAEALSNARDVLSKQGIEVADFPYMSGFEADDKRFIAPYLNFYVCNDAVIVPVAGAEPDKDEEALSLLGALWPEREIAPVRMRAGPMQGGAIHCLTQQVPML